ncbi:Chaperone protein YajL [Phytophthora nicotianae]|uniref:Chaperone protein YajL n=1 Tax=Phytophthora nicotianae TaxID=4792 RepID=A0A0W8CGQ3_PHYNI|nr:Chaperone protein YajL [Phytophthora nicotianae]
MVLSRLVLLCCALSAGSVAASIDFPDLSSYSQPCEPFTCRPKRAPAPVKDLEFTANGCGTSGMPISTSTDFQECCDWHDARVRYAQANCEKRLQKCMKAKCKAIRDPTRRDECFSTAKIFYIGANMIACPAYQDAQKEACECVPTENAAAATRRGHRHTVEEVQGQEPTMFLRVLKKYPKALKTDLSKTNFMDDIVKSADKDLKKKKKRKVVEKEMPVDEHEEL